jgi:hypothetical protein
VRIAPPKTYTNSSIRMIGIITAVISASTLRDEWRTLRSTMTRQSSAASAALIAHPPARAAR